MASLLASKAPLDRDTVAIDTTVPYARTSSPTSIYLYYYLCGHSTSGLEFVGFVMLYVAVIGLVTTTFVAYALGPAAAWIASSRWLILAVSFALILAMMLMPALGLRLGK